MTHNIGETPVQDDIEQYKDDIRARNWGVLCCSRVIDGVAIHFFIVGRDIDETEAVDDQAIIDNPRTKSSTTEKIAFFNAYFSAVVANDPDVDEHKTALERAKLERTKKELLRR